jgi:hypothetical protein
MSLRRVRLCAGRAGKRATLAVCWLLMIGCASAPASGPQGAAPGAKLPAGWSADPESSDLVHEGSGFRFAPTRNGCTRLAPHVFDDAGANASVGYDCPLTGTWLTFYVYPASFGDTPEPMEHFQLVVADALHAHPGARVERAVQRDLPLGPRELPGFLAYVQWFDESREVGSFVVLVPDGPSFVKVRTSFILGLSDRSLEEAWRLTEDVLRSVTSGGRTRPR